MHTHSGAEATILASGNYATYADVVWVGPTPNPVTESSLGNFLGYNPFLSARITADLDQPVVSAELRFHLGLDSKSLSPWHSGGPQSGGRPLLDPGMYLDLNVKCVGAGAAPGSAAWSAVPYRSCFRGRIDSTDPAEDDADVVVVRMRDLWCDLLDTWIEPGDAGGWPMSGGDIYFHLVKLVELVDTSNGGATNFLSGNYGVVGTPTMTVLPYNQQPGSGLLAMRTAALQNGWDLRGKYGTAPHGPDVYVMTYYQPDRTLSNPYLISPGRYTEIRGLAKSRVEVRNVVEVTPADAPRTPIKLVNTTSVGKYGRRYLGISEDATSQIYSVAQATALATAILSDTKEPKVTGQVTRLFHPFIEINDVITLLANNVQHDGNMVMAISGYEHVLDASGHAETTIHTRDIPAAANREWRDKQAPKMRYAATAAPSGRAAEGARWLQL